MGPRAAGTSICECLPDWDWAERMGMGPCGRRECSERECAGLWTGGGVKWILPSLLDIYTLHAVMRADEMKDPSRCDPTRLRDVVGRSCCAALTRLRSIFFIAFSSPTLF